MKKYKINFCIFLVAISLVLTFAACGQSKFEVLTFDAEPKEAAAGEVVTITATVHNSGSSESVYLANLNIDGTSLEKKKIKIAAKSNEKVTFELLTSFLSTHPTQSSANITESFLSPSGSLDTFVDDVGIKIKGLETEPFQGIKKSPATYNASVGAMSSKFTVELVSVGLVEGLNRGLVDVSAQGKHTMDTIHLTVTSTTDKYLRIVIRPGTMFFPQSTSDQRLIALTSTNILLNPHQKSQPYINTACMDMERDVPGESEKLTIRESAVSPDILLLTNLPDFQTQPFRIQQFAIWTITENPKPNDYRGFGFFGLGRSPSNDELQQIRLLFEKAGISTTKYQALQ
ncbi:MAG: CARDB domain-containing protein [Chloroflexota bacterium]